MKKILLVILLFTLTGCQVKYNIDIKDTKILENIKITTEATKENMDKIKSKDPYVIVEKDIETKYHKKFKKRFKKFEANYSYTYNPEFYNKYSYLKNCFDSMNFVPFEDGYVLITSTGFNCKTFDLKNVDKITFELTTNRVVIENNADNVVKGKYIWNVDKENAKDKKIYIKLGQVPKYNFFQKIIMFIKKYYMLFIIILILIVIGIVITWKIIKTAKENNDNY